MSGDKADTANLLTAIDELEQLFRQMVRKVVQEVTVDKSLDK
jgi:hypothetical protein